MASHPSPIEPLDLGGPVDDANEFDLPLTAGQLTLMRQVRELGRERFGPRAAMYDAENRFPTENYDDLRRAGLLALLIPAEHGGMGADSATYCFVSAELARWCGSTALSYNMHSCTMMWSGFVADDLALDDETRAGHDTRRAGLYRLVLEEDALFAQPFSEPQTDLTSGREPFGATAVRVDGGWRLSGRKHFASLAGAATHYGILCTETPADGSAPSFRHTLYLAVAADSPGFSVSGEWDVLGMRATMSRDLLLDDVFVPDEMTVMPSGAYFLAARDWPHIFMTISPTYLGLAEAAVDLAVAYLKGEVEGSPRSGSPTITKQLALAECQIRVQEARALMLRSMAEARYRPTAGARMRAMMCHRTMSKVAHEVTGEVLRICGGRALFKRFPLERMHRDARAGAVMLPWTADICLERVAEMTFGRPPG